MSHPHRHWDKEMWGLRDTVSLAPVKDFQEVRGVWSDWRGLRAEEGH